MAIESTSMRVTPSFTPLQQLIGAYLTVLIAGGVALCLLPTQQPGAATLDHLFTATSALSTTGLTTVNVRDTYTFGGELIVLLLLQLGGIGYMSLAGTLLLESDYSVWQPGEEDDDDEEMVTADYSVPDRTDLRGFVKKILSYTLVCELIGSLVLAIHFSQAGMNDAVWRGVFTAISAFCTAGFHLFDTSLHDFTEDVMVNVTVSLLSLAGSFGFLFFSDVFDRIRGCRVHLSLSTRVIVLVMVVSVAMLSVSLYLSAETIRKDYTTPVAIMISIFTSISAVSTTGFSTVPISGLSAGSILLLILFMFIGASPSGTGGGIKNTTFATAVAFIVSVVRRKSGVLLLGQRLSDQRTHMAIGLFLACLFLAVCASAAILTDDPSLGQSGTFEVYSALGTVGLSLGATDRLSVFATWIIMLLMMIGRLGLLSVLMATIGKSPDTEETDEADGASGDDIAIDG